MGAAIRADSRQPCRTRFLNRHGRLVGELRQRFEHIVLDSPPLLLVTDGILLSTLADGVVLVVESGGTSRGALHRVRQILDRSGANTLGAVLNKLDDRGDGYYTSRYRYYGYYYSRSPPRQKLLTRTSAIAVKDRLLKQLIQPGGQGRNRKLCGSSLNASPALLYGALGAPP